MQQICVYLVVTCSKLTHRGVSFSCRFVLNFRIMKSKRIAGLIGKINEAVTDARFPGLSKLEYDLLMQHLRSLYEELDALRNVNEEPVKKEMGKADEVFVPDTLPI